MTGEQRKAVFDQKRKQFKHKIDQAFNAVMDTKNKIYNLNYKYNDEKIKELLIKYQPYDNQYVVINDKELPQFFKDYKEGSKVKLTKLLQDIKSKCNEYYQNVININKDKKDKEYKTDIIVKYSKFKDAFMNCEKLYNIFLNYTGINYRGYPYDVYYHYDDTNFEEYYKEYYLCLYDNHHYLYDITLQEDHLRTDRGIFFQLPSEYLTEYSESEDPRDKEILEWQIDQELKIVEEAFVNKYSLFVEEINRKLQQIINNITSEINKSNIPVFNMLYSGNCFRIVPSRRYAILHIRYIGTSFTMNDLCFPTNYFFNISGIKQRYWGTIQFEMMSKAEKEFYDTLQDLIKTLDKRYISLQHKDAKYNYEFIKITQNLKQKLEKVLKEK